MKKIARIATLLICLLAFTACGAKKENNNEDNLEKIKQTENMELSEVVNSSADSGEEELNDYFPILSSEQIEYNNIDVGLSEEELVEKYKLIDGYFLDDYNAEEIDYNILNYGRIINANYEFVSDGKEFEIHCDEIEEVPLYNLTLNGKLIIRGPFDSQESISQVGVVDIDPNDNFKEIVIYKASGLERRNCYL